MDKTAAFPDFRFWIKLHQSFTHERQLDKAMLAAFRECLQPLAAAGKLAGLLAQFPYSFHCEPASLSYLGELAGHFQDLPLAVEFRHQGWLDDEVLAFFKSRGLIWTNIDQPQVSWSLALTALVTRPGHGLPAAARPQLAGTGFPARGATPATIIPIPLPSSAAWARWWRA